MSFRHETVLADEALALLAPAPGRTYVDGTVGGAGHAVRILDASGPDGRLIAVDRDPDALAAARERLAPYRERVTLVHDSFGNIADVLGRLGVDRVDGFLLDLGVSSHQLDTAERGFSFSHDGPLDMRMDPTRGDTALDLIRQLTRDELADVLRELGEERFSARIAAVIKERARAGDLATTAELAAVVTDAIPAKARRHMRIHPATRTFQALRIAVNRELEELARFLAAFPEWLAPGGRCVIISFHSLEDRLVKRRFRELESVSGLPPDLAARAGERTRPVCRRVTRKPIAPSDAEIARNPRARSARLRACEKVED
ncbi:MAG: 16S rRNA (cytosine(1402)-N(4))-methyltransferase RsmH [Deltaproteobacteria bacterium]|nr:MAG: 16S rRNA (cytosine(1402)-N(4))-methyltransferase RsmH [Deltaproteobacteria bacterium]